MVEVPLYPSRIHPGRACHLPRFLMGEVPLYPSRIHPGRACQWRARCAYEPHGVYLVLRVEGLGLRVEGLQGYLAHKKDPLPRTLHFDYT